MNSVVLLPATSADIIGNKIKAGGYYGYSDSMYTLAIYTTNFTGRIYIQGTLASNPVETDWFNISLSDLSYLDLATSTDIAGYTVSGNYTYIRAKVTNRTEGTIDKILVKIEGGFAGIRGTSGSSGIAGVFYGSSGFAMKEIEVLDLSDQELFQKLRDELQDSWRKRQVFRTETEMRLSVLNDGKHPTPASKYWQAVREQSVFFDNLMALSFEYRRNLARLEHKEKKLEIETDPYKRQLLEIDIDEKRWIIDQQKLEAHHRIRELEHWSRIKAELDDGSFNTSDPNSHQAESLPMRFENDLKSLTPGTPSSETRNVIGLVNTARKFNENKKLTYINNKKENNLPIEIKKIKTTTNVSEVNR